MIKVISAIETVKEYLRESEMEGKVNYEDSWYPIYTSLIDLQLKVLEEQNSG